MSKAKGALLIKPRTAKERSFIESLLKRLGVTSHTLSDEDMLDLGLAAIMRRADRTKKVEPKAAMKILAS